jgi:hypothetical protein
VRYRLDRHDTVGPRLLALIPAADWDRVPDGEVGRLDKGPGQVGVAVLDVPPSFPFDWGRYLRMGVPGPTDRWREVGPKSWVINVTAQATEALPRPRSSPRPVRA